MYILFGDQIASIFTLVPKVQEDLKNMLFWFGFISLSDIILNYNGVLMRTAGWSNFLSVL